MISYRDQIYVASVKAIINIQVKLKNYDEKSETQEENTTSYVQSFDLKEAMPSLT